jgi:signal peptidase I
MENNLPEIIPDKEPAEPKKKHSSAMGFFIDTIETILMAVVLFLIINTISSRVRVENISMKPTLQPGELLIVNKLAYKWSEADHGDIVVFHFQGNTDNDYIKRVIGLPGDEININNGAVSVNGYTLNEPYISDPPMYVGSWTVPVGQLFVLGDNRNNSSDSHQWGYVDMDDVVGQAVFKYWPLNRIRTLSIPDLVQAAKD